MDKTTKIILAVVGGVLLSVACVCGGGAALLFYAGVRASAGPEGIVSSADAPLRVAQGERFVIEVSVENTADKTQKLTDIDIYEEYLEGVAITASNPPFLSSSRTFGIQTYTFNRDLSPGEQVVIRFDATAVRPGDWMADLDVVINSDLTFQSHTLRTLIEAP